MRVRQPLVLLAAFTSVSAAPLLAVPTQQTTKADTLNDKLAARLAIIEAELSAAIGAKRVPPAQAARMRKKIASIRTGSSRLVRQQGFLSAAESASYNRELVAIEARLGV